MDDSRQILSPPKAAKIDDLSHAIQAWGNLEQRHRERTGDQLPKDMRLAILLSMCPTDLERELTAQQHLFPDYAQMRARIVTVINNRTRGPAPKMMRNLNDEASRRDASREEFEESEDGELYRSEMRNGTKVFIKPRHDSSKANTRGGSKGSTDKECFRCGRTGHMRADCKAKTHINGRNLHPGENVLDVERKKIPKHHKMCHWGPSIWGPLRCCQTTMTPKKMMVMLMNS